MQQFSTPLCVNVCECYTYNQLYASKLASTWKSQETGKCLKLICWQDDGWTFEFAQNHRTVIWHSFVSFTIPQWIESCNRHFVRTLVASPTMAFERQTVVRAAGRSSTAVKVVVLFELRQPKFSIMSVSLQGKETFVSRPCPSPDLLISLGYYLFLEDFLLAPFLLFLYLSFCISSLFCSLSLLSKVFCPSALDDTFTFFKSVW